MESTELTITHLYPEEMNLYGDLGNVITIKKRAEWRGIKVKINNIGINNTLDGLDTDIYFFGGGQDSDQIRVFKDLIETKKEKLKKDIREGVAMLAICGGYQLLGNYFLDANGNKIEGLGILPLETASPGEGMINRAVGNLVTELDADSPIVKHYSGLRTLVGFENHSGRTRIGEVSDILPLGRVRVGEGDNEDQVSDGVIFKSCIGTYMHGSVLPKNPHLADFLILRGLEHRYGEETKLEPLKDEEEIEAHNFILKRYKVK